MVLILNHLVVKCMFVFVYFAGSVLLVGPLTLVLVAAGAVLLVVAELVVVVEAILMLPCRRDTADDSDSEDEPSYQSYDDPDDGESPVPPVTPIWHTWLLTPWTLHKGLPRNALFFF